MMRQHLLSLRRHALPAAFTVAACLIAYWVWWWPAAPAPGVDDLSQINAPQRMLLSWFYRQGQLPLWNPWSFGGQPFLAAGQSGPFYPPNLLFVLLPIVPALHVSYTLHIAWGALGAYALMQRWSGHRWAGAAAATAWVTSGPLLEHEIHTQMFQAAMWLPWIGWLTERVLDGTHRRAALALPVCMAMEVLCGHPQVTFMVMLLVATQTLLRCVLGDQRPRPHALIRLAAGGTWGILLAAAQWMPTLDLTSYSSRVAASASFLLEGSLRPRALLQWLIPLPFGGGYTGAGYNVRQSVWWLGDNFWEMGCYVGVVIILTAWIQLQRSLTKVWAYRRSLPQAACPDAGDVRALGFAVAAVLFTLLALGGFGPLSPVLTHVPGFTFFRDPGRYLLLSDMFIAGTASVALAGWMSGRWSWRWRGLLAGWATVVAIVLLLRIPRSLLVHAPSPAVVLPACICLATAAAALWPVQGVEPRRAGAVLCGLAWLDVILWGASFSSFVLWAPPSYVTPNAVQQYLRQHLPATMPFIRAASLGGSTSISQDKALAWHIPVLNGEDSLVPWWYADTVNLQWGDGTFLSQARSFADAFGVRYIVTPTGQAPFPAGWTGDTKWHTLLPTAHGDVWLTLTLQNAWAPYPAHVLVVVQSTAGSRVYPVQVTGDENTATLRVAGQGPLSITVIDDSWNGWVWLTKVRCTDSAGETLASLHPGMRLAAPAWRPVFHADGQTVWENPDAVTPAWETADTATPLPQAATGTARLQTWAPSRQTWKVQGTTGGLLVISQTYDPHWQAAVDGRPAAVQRVLGALTAIPVPPGKHTVSLVYRSPAVWVGLWTSLCAGIGWTAMALRVTGSRWPAKRQA